MANPQEAHYLCVTDYRKGSPHLSHLALYDRLVEVLRGVIPKLSDQGLPLRVLEVGAGHGGFTEPTLALGCYPPQAPLLPLARRSACQGNPRIAAP